MKPKRDTENPLRQGMRIPDPCTLVIFGATGDLTRRKLIPAIYRLLRDRYLSREFSVVGIGRTEGGDDTFRGWMREALERFGGAPIEPGLWEGFARNLFYLAADARNVADYRRLDALLNQLDRDRGTGGNRLFYLATTPTLVADIVRQLGAVGLSRGRDGAWVRLVIEKPFGHDLASAVTLNGELREVFQEPQIFRIDHYLGKETVQNLLMFRFGNAIFEPLWNRQYVDHVQITVAENIGVGDRAEFYEQTGVVRDMFQNHLLQLLCLTAMEPPVDFEADAVRHEKVKILRAIRPILPSDVRRATVRGQYGPGWIAGVEVPAYRDEPKVEHASARETFAAIRFWVDNWRWRDVPFYLRSGKRLVKRASEIAVIFKETPHRLFHGGPESVARPNMLVFRIQPDEGISLRFEVKQPGPAIRLRPVTMDFDFATSFGQVETADAYQRLILDAILGDSTLFMRADEVELEWSVVRPILAAWESTPPEDFPNYEAGSWGPKAADELMERDGRSWRRL